MKSLNIALIGYGKMGRAIEEVIIKENIHKIRLKITSTNLSDLNLENLAQIDVAIDFTNPSSAYENVMTCFEANVPIVVGTTAWTEGLEKAKEICQAKNQALFASPNYSIGVNLFFKLNKQLAALMNPYSEYKLSMTEIHHTEKLDSPSGTAVKLANDLISAFPNQFSGWTENVVHDNHDIFINALRESGVPGTHLVHYQSEIDEIEIKHTAKSRLGFAIGAVRAAEFLVGKKGFYSMDDLLKQS